MVFSLYNPAIVYGNLELAPPIELQLVSTERSHYNEQEDGLNLFKIPLQTHLMIQLPVKNKIKPPKLCNTH